MHRAHAVSFAVSFTNLKIGISDMYFKVNIRIETNRIELVSFAVSFTNLKFCIFGRVNIKSISERNSKLDTLTWHSLDTKTRHGSPYLPGYFENVVWDSFFLDDPTKLARQAYLYTNKNCSRKVLCANPLGNSFNLQFMQFAANGSRAATDFGGGGGADVNTIALTLKVELVEEEIL